MAEYRLYRFDKDGHIQGPPVIVDCEDDDAAVTQAKQYVDGVLFKSWTAPVAWPYCRPRIEAGSAVA
ncbi:hypothetical protein ABIB06_000873 [Bradyrhizobium sp. LB8.2]